MGLTNLNAQLVSLRETGCFQILPYLTSSDSSEVATREELLENSAILQGTFTGVKTNPIDMQTHHKKQGNTMQLNVIYLKV
jgi:hypothetical protein